MTQLADPGAELLDRAQALWGGYGRIILGVVGTVAVVALLGFFMLRSRAAAEEQAAGAGSIRSLDRSGEAGGAAIPFDPQRERRPLLDGR
ncbi:MAG: hypothetical protein E6K80_06065 [Candidatus Eisenbacteria bacterium]|uniref:Uncharacterized protein n=1 Tax=Eiseniibacteriota bacterium TaxID=2212470 RepID=A0A538U5Z6_UNCEI|nr:MAG: hypothetical protein E6K80_06065 [Candidatus Eisenbacteria bacterium]